MAEVWRDNTEAVTCTTAAGEIKQLTRYPDSSVPLVDSRAFYSRKMKYQCGAEKIGQCVCNSHGTKAYGYKCYQEDGKNEDFWLCAICENHLGLRPTALGSLTPVTHSRADPLKLIVRDANSDEVTIHLCGGSVQFAVDLIKHGHISVTHRRPPPGEEVEQNCTNIWTELFPGNQRGSEFFGFDGNFRQVRNALLSMDRSREVIEFYERTEGRQIYFIIPALYQESNLSNENISFKNHCDRKYKGKPPRRSNWTWNSTTKVMRFQNRLTGLYIDIACSHGTIVEQDWFASGCDDSHVMDHCVLHANGSGTITFDHGILVGGEEIDTVEAYREFEREYDEDEDDEGGD